MTIVNFSVKICACLLKTRHKSLLSRKLQRGVALNFKAFNIKPRLVFIRQLAKKDLKKLKNIHQKFAILGLLAFFLLGYQPSIHFPLIKQTETYAKEQIQKIEADSIPRIQLPHPGYLSGRFTRFHPGVDIAIGLGMPVHPITDGEILEVNFGFWGYGNHVTISHTKGLKSLYAHLGRVYVKKGQKVSMADTLGTVGMTGFTSGPHTHLEITRNGSYIDPLTLLPTLQNYPSEEYLKPYADPPSGGQEKNLSKTLKPDFN